MPQWLNDLLLYHNRGNTTFEGESSEAGDFVGLDDLMTENPRVVQGFIEIFGTWIDRYGVDGFRIDTARHVNAEFWQAFVPAMLPERPRGAFRTSTFSVKCRRRTRCRAARPLHAGGEIASGARLRFRERRARDGRR